MPLLAISILLLFTSLSFAGSDDYTLVHNWNLETKRAGQITLTSEYRVTSPSSRTGEPEARLTLSVYNVTDDRTLSQFVESEISDITKNYAIGEYVEEDNFKPSNGIVSYIDEVNGYKVAFIKYRTSGLRGKRSVRPRSVIQAILVKDMKVYFVDLVIISYSHQEEVRGDQIRVVRGIIDEYVPNQNDITQTIRK